MPSKQPVAGPSRPKLSTATQAPPPPSVSGFNSSRTQCAMALPVLGSADKVTVWDITNNRVVSEWQVEGAAKVATLCWASTPSPTRRRKRKNKANESHVIDEEVLVIATQNEAVIFSPSRSEVVQRLSLSTPVTAAWSDDRRVLLSTVSSLLVLSPDLSSISSTIPFSSGIASPTAVAILPSSSRTTLHVLVANTSISCIHVDLESAQVTHTSSPLPASTSTVSSILPLPFSPVGYSFLVVSEDDRIVSQYTLKTPTAPLKLSYRFASPILSPAHSVALSPTYLSVLHSSGEISVFPVPTELDLVRPKSDSNPSSVKVVEGKDERQARVCRLTFAPDSETPSTLLCGRLTGGGRVTWHRAVLEHPEGGLKKLVTVKCEAQDLVNVNGSVNNIAPHRFAAPTGVVEAPPDDIEDETSARLPNDVHVADLSLGERLLALPDAAAAPIVNGDAAPTKAISAPVGPVNASSLTRLLVQALHTSDPALLAMCLAHRNPTLVRNTIRKMPAQLALPLLKACVERLGQGKGANKRGGGRGVSQSEQQARGTVEWVKGVLVERGALLMTMPSLPIHLAALSQLLSARLQLYQPLLSLSGRLDLALTQITMRRLATQQGQGHIGGDANEAVRYVEGESDEDEIPIEASHDDEVENIGILMNGTANAQDDQESDEEEEDDSDDDVLTSDSEDGRSEVVEGVEESDEEGLSEED
ncbi:hypothetical protein TREMEDRAFT_30693 [Tremella mesenterica DSM 1558]|uniref:uncharacterized protein n=1 Tax=Tremella mesenterica (strain ATCC 24925 / CBS 8224 / DSM 1558 / NBRC 9311 / NRRL Y-6157 / RJB 2259-6 / UBC 559-6) TaxID=578456 RepID=UPI0003F4A301|nr:uncharacterized protein TREMEDRAFT_30693 [Tremella mesenterica DSM 1558]EIW69495.1 hypothetical protein TREMEDRAFT_30693 [Tremella mesenterica DSM 1558]